MGCTNKQCLLCVHHETRTVITNVFISVDGFFWNIDCSRFVLKPPRLHTPPPTTPTTPTTYKILYKIDGDVLTARYQNKLISMSRSQGNAPTESFKVICFSEREKIMCGSFVNLSIICSRVLVCYYIIIK